jgi:hypothetical protein
LQINAIHPNLESATRPTRKGWVITVSRASLARETEEKRR